MGLDVVAQMMTLVLAVFAIIWNQQRATNRLREEFQRTNRGLRGEFQRANRGLRGEMNGMREEFQRTNCGLRGEMNGMREEFQRTNRELRGEMNGIRGVLQKLSDCFVANGQRLARIEGYLGIGIPPAAVDGATSPGLGASTDGVTSVEEAATPSEAEIAADDVSEVPEPA